MDGDGRRYPFDKLLAAIVVGFLLLATALTLQPFLPAILWAIVLAVTASPLHRKVRLRLASRPRLAAVVTSFFLVVILILPGIGLTRAIIAYTPGVFDWLERTTSSSFSEAPQSLKALPYVGETLSANWEFISEEGNSYITHFKQDIEEWLVWGLQQMETVGVFLFEFAIAIILAGVFLTHEERLSELARIFFARIGGELGTRLLDKSVATTRSTVRGVVGSAIAEALVATFAYFIAGVPAWLLLGGLTFFAALVQIGAPLVWIPVALWLLAEEQPGWALFMVVWGAVVVYGVENFSRPLLVSRSAHLPGLLIFIGVLGGLFAWGLIGVFLGPVILAIAYELIQEWFRHKRPGDPPTPAADAAAEGRAEPSASP